MHLLNHLKRSHFYFTLSSDFCFHRRIEWQIILKWLKPKAGENICDIGCGCGIYCLKLAKQGSKVLGIDLNKETVYLANRYNKIKDNQFIVGNAETIPIKTGSIDKVISVSALEHMDKDEFILRELNRILKPQGYIVMSVDSLSYTATSNRFREVHKNKYFVNKYYNLRDLKLKLEQHKFLVEKSQYILNSKISNFFYELDHAILTFPISYPLSKLSDRLFGSKECGGMLVIKARKMG